MRDVRVRQVIVMRSVKEGRVMAELCAMWEALRERRVRGVARVVVVLSRARQTVASSCVGKPSCGGLGVKAACPAVRAPGFGSRVCCSAGLVVPDAVRGCCVPSLGMLMGWVRASWRTVAAVGGAWPSVFATPEFLWGDRTKCGFSGGYGSCFGGCRGW